MCVMVIWQSPPLKRSCHPFNVNYAEASLLEPDSTTHYLDGDRLDQIVEITLSRRSCSGFRTPSCKRHKALHSIFPAFEL